jgi:hypothetical protein
MILLSDRGTAAIRHRQAPSLTKAIDIVVNLFGPDEIAAGQTGFDARFMDQVRMPAAMRSGVDARSGG